MPTIGSTLRSSAHRVPDRTALVFGDVRYTYRELDEAVDRLAGLFIERGLRKGDRLAMFSASSERFVLAMYATHRVGAIFVPINPASSPPELDYILRDSGSTVLTFAPALADVVATATTNGLPDNLQVFALGPADGYPDVIALAADRPATQIVDTVVESDDAHILYTSGTTGNPKGALFDHHAVMCTALAMSATCGVKDSDRLLHVAPLYHAADLCIMLIPGTLVGATHFIHQGFDPVATLDTMERERITMFFGVPTMFQFLLRQPSLPDRDLTAWRTGLFGAAPMPPSAVEQLVTTLPDVNFIQLAGQTEAGPSGVFCDRDQVRARPDASGRQAVVLTEVRIVDPDGNDVAPDSVGEMVLRGETLMKEYWNKPDATAETIVDGWLHTGDICRLDADGYITIIDRLKDMIITGGRNVYSIEVEGAIAAHPSVADAAVVGRPNEEWGESIVAFVTLVDGATLSLDEVRAFAGERISHYKLPHELRVVDSIPRNPSGKLLKRTLRDSFA